MFAKAYVERLTKEKWRESAFLTCKPSLVTNKKGCFILRAFIPTPIFVLVHKIIKGNVMFHLFKRYVSKGGPRSFSTACSKKPNSCFDQNLKNLCAILWNIMYPHRQ